MDELEFLKRDWKRQEADLPIVSTDSIYKMIHKRSSSLMKWILYISIFEFILWSIINFVNIDKESIKKLEQLNFLEIDFALTIIQYVILGFFIFCFYKNYRNVQTTQSTRDLMKGILKMRRCVNIYVIFNIVMFFVGGFLVFNAMASYDPHIKELYITNSDGSRSLPTGFILKAIGVFILASGLLWLFYKLLYGILLNKLKRNYKELSKLELQD